MATKSQTPEEPDQPDEPDEPKPAKPSKARTKFLAGELTWREYVEAENG